MLESFLDTSGDVFGEHVVAKVASFPQHESTQTLVRFAVLSPWVNVRQQAIAELKRRPLHDYVPMLLDGLTSPIQSQFFIGRDAAGNVRYQHAFFQENSDADYVLAREHIAGPYPRKGM